MRSVCSVLAKSSQIAAIARKKKNLQSSASPLWFLKEDDVFALGTGVEEENPFGTNETFVGTLSLSYLINMSELLTDTPIGYTDEV